MYIIKLTYLGMVSFKALFLVPLLYINIVKSNGVTRGGGNFLLTTPLQYLTVYVKEFNRNINMPDTSFV